jgi:hypothetical protein
MKVGLIDVDGHNFPSLCLMKIRTENHAAFAEVVQCGMD